MKALKCPSHVLSRSHILACGLSSWVWDTHDLFPACRQCLTNVPGWLAAPCHQTPRAQPYLPSGPSYGSPLGNAAKGSPWPSKLMTRVLTPHTSLLMYFQGPLGKFSLRQATGKQSPFSAEAEFACVSKVLGLLWRDIMEGVAETHM